MSGTSYNTPHLSRFKDPWIVGSRHIREPENETGGGARVFIQNDHDDQNEANWKLGKIGKKPSRLNRQITNRTTSMNQQGSAYMHARGTSALQSKRSTIIPNNHRLLSQSRGRDISGSNCGEEMKRWYLQVTCVRMVTSRRRLGHSGNEVAPLGKHDGTTLGICWDQYFESTKPQPIIKKCITSVL